MITIKHSLKGRIRLKYKEMTGSPSLAAAVEESLLKLQGVSGARCSHIGGNIVINYDCTAVLPSDLIKAITETKPLLRSEINAPACKRQGCVCVRSERPKADTTATEFGILSAVLGGVFIRTKIFRLAVTQSLFSPLGLIAAAFSVPLIAKAVSDFGKTGKISLNSFLGAGVASAAIAGEALTALEILWVNTGSDLLNGYVTEKSRKAIKSILDVTSKTAFVYRDGNEIEIPVEDILVGDTVVIHTGEKISVDGLITCGEAAINEASINGRSELVHRFEGEQVFAGTYVQNGLIYVQASHVGDATYLSRILCLVEDSLGNKAPIELEADRLARKLVNTGFWMTLGTYLVTRSFYRAFSVLLVMTCPCATVLAASSAVSAAISNAASRGILIKGGRYLEEAGSQESFCFDKTGTITTDEPKVISIIPIKGKSEYDVIYSAYTAELHNRHPVAVAIRDKAREMCSTESTHAVCETILGMGVRAESMGREIFIGNAKLMNKYGISITKLAKARDEAEKLGLSVIYVAEDGKVIGILTVENKQKENVEAVIKGLREEGVKEFILVTGDEKYSAQAMADRLGFNKCHYSVLPEQKADIVAEIQQYHKVTMIGDGINDVLALAKADLGIAMGAAGSDVAVEAADIALVDDDLEKILYLRKLSRKTKEVIHQNFMLATGSNVAGAFLGAAGLLPPVMAGLLHIAHTAGVLANSSRLLKYEMQPLSVVETEAAELTEDGEKCSKI
ncbi:cation-translocating P-type ATPase [Geovibrio thiophilus]|uniref:P-type Zn(2+) transporter n=1 Tax=Geovibrio thiophilus TaxID=139438 RepID=A0A3R5UYH2_9BACT|nr:cation-translocating P-type ATPase [Geovibrio thiophilus]QAR32906.1 cation-translocating P-type ATPase [Geovibrio thiophilus]